MLQHVTIEVSEEPVGACVRFYALLGFQKVEPPSGHLVLDPAGHRAEVMAGSPARL